MKNFLIIIMIGCLTTTFAQKELTLKDAVMGQYRQFYPENIFDFQWIPNTGDYSYLKNYTTLVHAPAKGKEKDLLTIAELNEALETQFLYFSGLKWKDKTSFYVMNDKQLVLFDYQTKKGRKITFPENAQNVEVTYQTGQVAFTVNNNVHYMNMEGEHKEITLFEDKNIVSGQAIARSEFGITGGLFWSPKARKLAFYQKDESEVHDYPLLDINKYPGELNAIKYPMAGQKSEKPRVGIYHFKSGKTFYIEPQSGADSYLTNLQWTPDGEHIILAEVNRGQNHCWLKLYSAEGKFIKDLYEEVSNTWVEPEKAPFFPTDDPNKFIWVSENDGFDNLYLIEYNDQAVSLTQITKNKFVVKDILHSNSKGEIFFTATGENPLNTLLYKVDLKGKQTLLTPEEGMHYFVMNEYNDMIFDTYSAHDVPNRSVIRNPSGKIMKTLVEAKNPLADFGFSEAEIKTIKADDGTDLYTRLIKPRNFDPSKKYPVLIYVYGGPHAQLITNSWLDGASLWMYWMADQGYLVFTLDNRGSAHRGREFEHVIHRKLGTNELKDQLSGVDYLKKMNFVDTNRIAVHGWSFGGFMTGTMLMKAPETFKVGVAGGPVTDWKYYEIMYGERYMDKPEENEEGYLNNSLIENAENLKGDLLLIHGTSDDVVVMQHNLALVQEFVKLGKQVDFFPYPMHKHNVGGKDRIHLMEKVLTYILENNK
ncbi:MAG: DPP IV N-terminal domain-containing protein [Brumimicrobium sp.]|nr:DPP IV N-terminal domain-containing protein [Brumimicrobium sp.]